jgi:hypothetical protein
MAKKSTKQSKTTRKRAAAKPAERPLSAQSEDEISHRVFRWDSALRNGLRERREQLGVTQKEAIRAAVASQLPQLIESLAALGISVENRTSEGPIRLPVATATLAALRSASNWTDLPMSLLMQACARLWLRESAKPTRRRRTAKK